MKNKELVELNFRVLLNYGGMPPVENTYTVPPSCSEFCISSEQQKFLQYEPSIVLDQMSHGADTWDFEQILGDMPTPYNKRPVVFLLESPGGYYKTVPREHIRALQSNPLFIAFIGLRLETPGL